MVTIESREESDGRNWSAHVNIVTQGGTWICEDIFGEHIVEIPFEQKIRKVVHPLPKFEAKKQLQFIHDAQKVVKEATQWEEDLHQ